MHEPSDRKSTAAAGRVQFLHRCKARLAAFADRFLVEEWLPREELSRRARLIVRVGLLGFLFGLAYGAFYGLIRHYWGFGIIVVGSAAFAAIPFIMRATRSVSLAGNFLSGILAFGFSALCAVEGGLSGHAIGWLAAVPLWAILLVGMEAAKWWAFICLLSVGAFGVAAEVGIAVPRTYDPEWEKVISGAGYLGLVIFMFIVGTIFENLREQARIKKEDALHRLEISNEKLVALNNEKNEFMGIAAHDLRLPLSSIIIGAELLGSPDAPADRSEVIEIILGASTRMRDLITSLLDANAIEQGRFLSELGRCDLSALASGSVENNRRNADRKTITIQFGPLAELPVLADQNAATQILDNLISNAVKYSPQGTAVHVCAFAENGKACVSVKDEGPGISEADRRKMFGKFARLSARPTGGESSVGLGLAIVKRLAEAMSGTVECQSVFGQGATFIVRLPEWQGKESSPHLRK